MGIVPPLPHVEAQKIIGTPSRPGRLDRWMGHAARVQSPSGSRCGRVSHPIAKEAQARTSLQICGDPIPFVGSRWHANR